MNNEEVEHLLRRLESTWQLVGKMGASAMRGTEIKLIAEIIRKQQVVVRAAYASEKHFKDIDDGFFTGLVPPEFAAVSKALRELETDT